MMRLHMESINPYKLMWLVVAAAFIAVFPAWVNYDIISTDGAFQYIPTAEMFLKGKFIQGFAQAQPLFPLLIAGISWISGFDPELSGRLISAGAFIIAALGIFKFSELIFKDRLIALIAVLFMITNRELVQDSADCLKESLLVCCIVWGNFFVMKGVVLHDRYRKMNLFVGCLIFIPGMLMRSTSLFFLWAWLVVWALSGKRFRFAKLSLVFIPVLAFYLAWVIDPELPVFKKSYDLGLIFHGERSISRFIEAAELITVQFFATGNPIIMLASFFGLYHWRRDLYPLHVCLVLAFFLAVLIMWEFVSKRYLLAPIVWMYPLAAYAVVEIFARAEYKIGKVAASLVVVTALAFWADKVFEPPDKDRLARKEAGNYILQQIGPHHDVITNRDRVAFYAQAKYIPLTSYILSNSAPGSVIVLDIVKEEGKVAKNSLETFGRRPDQIFKTIYVYLPRS